MRIWLAIAAAGVLLSGCGAAAAQPGGRTPHSVALMAPAASASTLRERALALAERYIGELRPPHGTRTVHLKKLPPPLNQPQPALQPGWVRVTETLEAPTQPESAWTTMLARTPLNDGPMEPGESASAILPAPESGIDVAAFGVTLVRLSSSTVLIFVDAEAVWLPTRTAAEHLNPAAFRSVTISAQPWQGRITKRTFTSEPDIARLTSIINTGVPAPLAVVGGMSCAPVAIVYTLRFTPRAADGPSVVVAMGACPHAYGITVNGKQQPSLWDNGKLRAAAASLLGIKYPLGV
jgi:hypothetical protein